MSKLQTSLSSRTSTWGAGDPYPWHTTIIFYIVLLLHYILTDIHYLTRLADKLKEAQNIKEEINREINQKTEYLDSLQPKLNNILQVNVCSFLFAFLQCPFVYYKHIFNLNNTTQRKILLYLVSEIHSFRV